MTVVEDDGLAEGNRPLVVRIGRDRAEHACRTVAVVAEDLDRPPAIAFVHEDLL